MLRHRLCVYIFSMLAAALVAGCDDETPPSVDVTFPLKYSKTENSRVTIRGVARDDALVTSITVNGEKAAITGIGVEPAAQPKVTSLSPLNKVARSKTGSSEPELVISSDSQQETSTNMNTWVYEWEITLDLDFGDTPLEILVEDFTGKRDETPAELLIRSVNFPYMMLHDRKNHRVISLHPGDKVKAVSLLNDEFSDLSGFPLRDNAKVDDAGKVLYSAEVVDGNLKVNSVDMDTGIESVDFVYDLQLDPELWLWAAVRHTTFAPEINSYFVLVFYAPTETESPCDPFDPFCVFEFRPSETAVFRIDLNAGKVNPLTQVTGKGGDHQISDIVWSGSALLGMESKFEGSKESLLTIDHVTGDVSTLVEDTLALAAVLGVDGAGEYAYLVGYDDIAKVHLENKTVEYISPNAEQDFYDFSQIRELIVDDNNKRLIVRDSNLKELVTVDTDSGVRGLLYQNGIGSGHKLIAPHQLALSSDNSYAYVLDDGGSVALFRVDLSTGDRVEISDLNQSLHGTAHGVALDETKGKVYVALDEVIGVVDIDSEIFELVVAPSVGTGVSTGQILGLSFDTENQRLLALSVSQSQKLAVAINPETLERTVLANLVSEGDGPEIPVPVDLEVSVDGKHLYILGQMAGALFSVELATGKRTRILDECFDDGNRDYLVEDGVGQGFDFNRDNGTFIIVGEAMLKFDLEKNECRVLNSSITPLDLLYLNDGKILGSYFNMLVQFDPVTGQHITISQ